MSATTCKRMVDRGSWNRPRRTCGRALNTDEQREAKFCGPHLAGQKRSKTIEMARAERGAAEHLEVEAVWGAADRFRALLPDDLHGEVWAAGDEIRMRRPVAERLLGLLEADEPEEGSQ